MSKSFVARLLLVLLFVCLQRGFLLSAGTTYYVSTTGNDSTGNGSITTPWRNPTRCFTAGVFVSGDTCHIVGGTYTGSGARLHETTITIPDGVSSSVRTVIEGEGEGVTILAGPGEGGINLESCSNITIRNMTLDGVNDGNSQGRGIRLNQCDTVLIEHVETKNHSGGFITGTNGTLVNKNLTLRFNTFHDHILMGIYFRGGDNILIEHNTVYSTGGTELLNTGIGQITNLVMRYNVIRNNIATASGTPSCSSCGFGVALQTATGTQFYGNIVHNNQTAGISLQGTPNILLHNNISYANGSNGIQCGLFASGSQTCQITNNIVTANGGDEIAFFNSWTNTGSHNACTAAESCSNAASKITIGALTDITVSTSDFTHNAGSAGINAGTSVSTRTCNGTCDLGPFETAVATSGTVTGNTAAVQVDMNLRTPLQLGASPNDEWIVDVDGVDRGTTSVTLVGSSVASIVFDGGSCTSGQVIRARYVPGLATDSALIGNSLNQKILAFGPITLTNNCSGASYLLTQTKGAVYSALGSQATTLAITDVKPGGLAAIRTKWKATLADPPALTSKLQVSCNGAEGTYADLANTFGTCNIRYVGIGSITGMDEHTATISDERLTSEFSGMTNGAVVRCSTGCEIPSVDLAQDSESEQVDMVEVDSDATPGTVYHFRRVLVDDTTLTYAANSKPSLPVVPPGAVGGF